MNFSKTKYVEYMRCPKAAWLTAHKPQIKSDVSNSAMQEGTRVGELAKGYFGEDVDMTTYRADGSLDLAAMIEKTKRAISDGVQNICEAAFAFEGNYCAVDILHRVKRGDTEGYEIYEVKSTSEMKDYYYYDIGYQEYVARKCGVNILDSRVLYINNGYTLQGKLDVHNLFQLNDKSKIPLKYQTIDVQMMLTEAEAVCMREEFDCCGQQCKGEWCGYYDYCMRNFPKPNVLGLYGFREKWKCVEEGILSFEDLLGSGVRLTGNQARQIDFALHDRGTHVEKEKIKSFLDTLSYPLYFLDFETMRFVIPEFDGTRPYEQIPFQYSLHFIESENGELKHKEFLGVSGQDPRRQLAEYLVHDIPDNVCVLAYNKSFECGRIKDLARLFLDLSGHLLKICENLKDLLDPFRNGYFYNEAIGGSFSIKSVLPALFPNDPTLNYHNLEGVQNGTEAMDIFPKIKNMPQEEADRARQNLLEYCKLDTFAMVKIWQELRRISN